MRFQLPKTKFVGSVTLKEQITKVIEEAREIRAAYQSLESPERIIEEALHTYQALETLFRQAENEYGPAWLEDQLQAHIRSMTDRGYYGHSRLSV